MTSMQLWLVPGLGGIYALKNQRDLGLSVLAIDAAGDVGGTWY